MSDSKRFLIQTLVLTLSLMALVGVVNYMVDPYGIYRTSLFPVQPSIFAKHRRMTMPVDVVRSKPKTIFLGTSRTRRFQTTHPALEQYSPISNIALQGSSIYEQNRLFKHALDYQPQLKVVIMGVDFFAFGSNFQVQPGFKDSRLGRQPRFRGIALEDCRNTLFSLDSFLDSLDSVKLWSKQRKLTKLKSKAQITPSSNSKTNFISVSESVLQSYLQREDRYKNYRFSPERLAEYKEMVDMSSEGDVRFIPIILPIHSTMLESIYLTELWDDFLSWKKSLVQIAPTWDFSGYNEITTEAMKDTMAHYEDPSHFNSDVADLILDSIFNETNEFGVLLTRENVEQYNDQLSLQRKQWLIDRPSDAQFVQAVVLNKHPEK